MITIPCPNCSAKLRIKEEMAGKKARCPKCTTSFVAQDSEDEVVELSADAIVEGVPQKTRSGKRKRRKKKRREPALDIDVNKWMKIGFGGLTLVTMLVTFFFPMGILAFGALGFLIALAAQGWIVVCIFQHDPKMGAVALLLPLIGFYLVPSDDVDTQHPRDLGILACFYFLGCVAWLFLLLCMGRVK